MSGVSGGKAGVGHATGAGRGGENQSGPGSRQEMKMKPKTQSAKRREKFKLRVAASDPAAVAKNIERKQKAVARRRAKMTPEQKAESNRKRKTTYAKRAERLGEDGAKLHVLRRQIRNLDNRLKNYARQALDVTDSDTLVALKAKEDETKSLKSEKEEQADLLQLKLK